HGRVCGFGSLGVLQHLIHGFPLVETRIRAHGTRQPALSEESAGIATVLFHPDFDRRLRSCTESADPSSLNSKRKALAGLGFLRRETLTAGGDFHPALRTSAGSG